VQIIQSVMLELRKRAQQVKEYETARKCKLRRIVIMILNTCGDRDRGIKADKRRDQEIV
jgi:hypothetical protein